VSGESKYLGRRRRIMLMYPNNQRAYPGTERRRRNRREDEGPEINSNHMVRK